ncbi:MAG: glutamine amidotransferase [Deltaproteobacteria bacterium]|nr:glutamine amidotransferase [Deltaproteobacteria bacterium]
MKSIYIIKAGTTFPTLKEEHGDFDLWTIKSMGISQGEAVIIDIQNIEPLPEYNECRGVVITGSHDMVTDHLPWSDLLLEWIPGLVRHEIPFMGICYGHQLLAEAMGGKVGFHPKGKEIGTVEVKLSSECAKDPLLIDMPASIPVHVTHAQSALMIPAVSTILASNDFEPYHAIRIGASAWGVQFHPEYSTDIMKAYIINQADELMTTGHNIDEIMETVKETPQASSIMKRFVHYAKNNGQ